MADTPPMANIKVEGDKVITTLSNGKVIIVAFAELPPAQKDVAGVHGLASFVRTAYSNSADVDEAATDIQSRIDALRAGTWLPNTRSSGGMKEPDDLARAVMEARGISFAVYTEKFLPWWFTNPDEAGHTRTQTTTTRDGETRVMGKAKALKELAAHPQVAPLLAKYASERARALRGTAGKSLDGFSAEQPSPASQEAA